MKERILIIYAMEDRSARDWLVMHLADAHGRYEFTDVPPDEPFDSEWKTRCRRHIKTCNRAIAIISKNTRAAHAARWQMECAGDEGKPTLGVHKWVDAKGKVPPELAGCKIIEWTWEGISAFLDGSDESGSLRSTTLPSIGTRSRR